MEYQIESIATNIIRITIGVTNYNVLLSPVKITNDSYEEVDADITVSPSITPVNNLYTLTGSSGTEYDITFNEDGVYKLYITENAIDYLNIAIISNEVDAFFEEYIPNLISSTPLTEDDSNREYYDFNVISILTIEFFGNTNQNIFLNYEDLTSGILYEGNIYQCNNIGSGTYNWHNAGGDDLLNNLSGQAVTNTAALELNKYYKCVKTGTPVSWGGTTPTELTLYSDYFDVWIKKVVDSLYTFNIYVNTNIDS